jgi:cation diffusion facilitator CzcD-associated flavoprotein CzcO
VGDPLIPHGEAGPTIAIVGAGIAGLCMGIRLKRAGIDSFTIYEKSDRVGGTWRENSYPGSGCDVPSHLYSFSFDPNPDFSRKYSGQEEIERYIQACAERSGLLPHIRFNTEISGARFDEVARVWRLRTRAGGEFHASVLVSGTGQLNRPATPHLEGLADFGGTSFHSALWNHDHPLAGRRVAVIGNGASAVQLVPHVAEQAARLTLFQRTPNWIVPRGDRVYTAFERWVFRNVPLVLFLYRALIYWLLEVRFLAILRESPISEGLQKSAVTYMESQITSARLRRVLVPDYPIGCKRILISDDYYPALERPNVEVVTEPIERFTREGPKTVDGTQHAVDTVIFATGFETTTFLAPMEIEGAGARKLTDAWRGGAEAYLGIAVSGFPNLFLLYGPNTNLGHNSIIFMIECQVGYIVQCIERLRTPGLAALDVKPDEMARYNAKLQEDLKGTAWSAGCTSWYKTESGKVTNNWSGFTVQYWWRTRRPDFRVFDELRV